MAVTRKSFDMQLKKMQEKVSVMGYFVADMLTEALNAVLTKDLKLAERVIAMDDTVDEMDLEIENMCLQMLARQQPLGSDLRLIAATFKVISDIERIGDYAEDIAKITPVMVGKDVDELLKSIPKLGEMAVSMIRNAVTAFINADVELAHQVCKDDAPTDRLFRQILASTVEHIKSNPQDAEVGVYTVLLARRLERTADHATNIAERVHYLVTGKLVQLARFYREF
ncbi:MAG: phosphate signaling complex protein PhoU [Armatimonadota bacterium]|nr:phosphate signaling complex protein PhoU [Armatimonadota bacterium]MDW8026601.1 phosphate signaling complex protein PhoU [Armatimonadota bacterium]